MDIGAIGLLGAVTVYMTLIVLLLNKRIDDLKADFKDEIRGIKEGQTKIIASVAWLMAKADATPDELARLHEDPQSGDD